MKTVVIVQARMTSTRLPGKVLKEVLGRPLLQYQLDRLNRVGGADRLVVATTTNDTDDPIVELCDECQVETYRGSEDDVLARYFEAAGRQQADVVVRVTADCPLIDPAVIDKLIRKYREKQPGCDYVSNTLKRTYPIGLDAEVFSIKALTAAHEEAVKKPDREHVTPFIYHHPKRFSCVNVSLAADQSRHRWTVDTPDDFELIKRMIEALLPEKPNFTLEDCLRLIEAHPDWSALNSHVKQKVYRQ